MANPMSHSTHVGFNGPGVISFSSIAPCRPGGRFVVGPPSESLTVGVGKRCRSAFATATAKPSPLRLDSPALLWLPFTVGVGHRPIEAIEARDGRVFPVRPAAPPRLFPYGLAAGVGK